MSGPIYRPKGRAREYAPWALNYFNGCSGWCSYCYTEGMWPGFSHKADIQLRKGFSFHALEKQLKTFELEKDEYVLLCFAGDPYAPIEDKLRATERVLGLFLDHEIPTRILSKMGCRCLRDLPLFDKFNEQGIPLMVGQTLTFVEEELSKGWEPGAALPGERLRALQLLHEAGIATWASLEPVIEPKQSLFLMKLGLDIIDYYAVGKVNHMAELEAEIDWGEFGRAAVELLEKNGKAYLIKDDLKARMVA